MILGQSQTFSSLICKVGLPPPLVTLGSPLKQREVRQHEPTQRGQATSTVGSDVYKMLQDSWKARRLVVRSQQIVSPIPRPVAS